MGKPRIKKRNRLAGAALLALAAAAGAAPPSPDPGALLEAALSPPDIAYQGRMMVTHWFGKRARAEEVEVYHAPGGRSRREFLAPDGSVERVVVSDGEREEVRWLLQRRTVVGDAVRSYEKVMPPERERELLLKNYKVSVLRQEKVAGRAAWALSLEPTSPGKPHQRLWIDDQTRAVLENKRFLPDGRFAALSRFSRFEPKQTLDEGLFSLAASTAAARAGLEPDFMTLEDLDKATGKAASLPAELPGGFVFESADFFPVGRATVRHARYTDGLAVVSVFETDQPVSFPKGGSPLVSGRVRGGGAGDLRLSSAGRVLTFRRGKRHDTLMGDVSLDLLQAIAARLKSSS